MMGQIFQLAGCSVSLKIGGGRTYHAAVGGKLGGNEVRIDDISDPDAQGVIFLHRGGKVVGEVERELNAGVSGQKRAGMSSDMLPAEIGRGEYQQLPADLRCIGKKPTFTQLQVCQQLIAMLEEEPSLFGQCQKPGRPME